MLVTEIQDVDASPGTVWRLLPVVCWDKLAVWSQRLACDPRSSEAVRAIRVIDDNWRENGKPLR